MRVSYIILLLLILPMTSFAQATEIISLFQVTDTILTDREQSRIEDLKKKKKPFYEDDQYVVSRSCSGEWGGTLKFKNKKTGIEHSCESTCPVSVNKIGDCYLVTNTLAHLSGFTQILEITNPDSMEVFHMPPPRKKKGKKTFYYAGDNESKSTSGRRILLDSIGMLALGSFLFDEELFHVVTDFKKTYIAKIVNKKFRRVEFITARKTWLYDNDLVKTDDGHLIITIDGGYLDIFDNQIRLLRSR